VKAQREVETKLGAPADLVMPSLHGFKGVQARAARSRPLVAVYFDTDDLVLARAGLTLRHRTGEGRARWTLKVPGGESGRNEITVVAPAEEVPTELLGLVQAWVRGRPAAPVVSLRTRRRARLLVDGEGQPLVEVVDDQVVSSRDGEDGRAWREVEVEQAPDAGAAGRKLAAKVVDLLRASGAHETDQTPKALIALGVLLSGSRPPRPGDPAIDVVRHALRTRTDQLRRRDLDVKLGQEDSVHQFRVTCRRLRSELRVLRPLIDDPRAEQVREELAWLAGSFGAARDLEVLRAHLRDTATLEGREPLDEAPVELLLAQREQSAKGDGLEVLSSDRYLRLLTSLDELADAVQPSRRGTKPCRRALPPLVDKAWRRMRRRVRRLKRDGPSTEWHRTRIAAKRARYSAETAGLVLGRTRFTRRARKAERVQDLLGEHQDSVQAVDTLVRLVEEQPGDAALALLCGELVEREQQRGKRLRRRFLAKRSKLMRG